MRAVKDGGPFCEPGQIVPREALVGSRLWASASEGKDP